MVEQNHRKRPAAYKTTSIRIFQKTMYLLVLVLIVALTLIVALLGHVLSDGILPNVHKGLSLITYPTERQFSS